MKTKPNSDASSNSNNRTGGHSDNRPTLTGVKKSNNSNNKRSSQKARGNEFAVTSSPTTESRHMSSTTLGFDSGILPTCPVKVCLKVTIATLVIFQVVYIPTAIFYYSQEPSSSRSRSPTVTVMPRPHDATTEATVVNDTIEFFLDSYAEFCERALLPKPSNVARWKSLNRFSGRRGTDLHDDLCPCIPDTLVGDHNLTVDFPYIGDLEMEHPELMSGGEWLPRTCVPRHRVAIIVPFRDREEHLRMFLNVLHPMLQRQLLHYTIFVVEQLKPNVFNKASLMNIGFLEARSAGDFDCFIFHDVDMLPLNDHNFYTCSDLPRHVGSHLDKFNYTLPYPELFGGATAFTSEQFLRVNGFSNQYYGWGGEDDDMYSRIVAQNLSIVRFSSSVARYSMIRHESDVLNPSNVKRFNILYYRHRHLLYRRDGINSVRYKLNSFESRPLYVWLQIVLPPHPNYFKNTYLMKTEVSTASTVYPSAIQVVFISIVTIFRFL